MKLFPHPLAVVTNPPRDDDDDWSQTSSNPESGNADLERLLASSDNDDMTGLLPAESRALAELGSKRRRALREMSEKDAFEDELDEVYLTPKRRFVFYVSLWLALMFMIRHSWKSHYYEIMEGRDAGGGVDYYADRDDFRNEAEAYRVTPKSIVEEGGPQSHIGRIAILGERHSGTQWLHSKLAECFPSVDVTGYLHRPSHWFQTDPSSVTTPTLVVASFINPYHWVNAVRLRPHYAPDHADMEWHAFVTTPWTSATDDESNMNSEKDICQFDFARGEVLPCEMSYERPALYEMRKANKPYSSIVKLRKAKIDNILQLESWANVEKVVPVRYESLRDEKGLAELLLAIENLGVGLKPSCEVMFNGPREEYVAGDIFGERVEEAYVEWMNEHVAWDVEARVGYERWTEMPYWTPTESPVKVPFKGYGYDASESDSGKVYSTEVHRPFDKGTKVTTKTKEKISWVQPKEEEEEEQGLMPTATPSAMPSPSPSAEPSASPSAMPSPSPSAMPSPSPTEQNDGYDDVLNDDDDDVRTR